MKILVTGGTGFIGSHTCVELLKEGYDVVIADDLSNSKEVVVDRIEDITGRRPAFYHLDICDAAGLEALFSKEDIDAVIHFAGYKAVGESVQKPVEYYRNNLLSTLNLCSVMKKYGTGKFIFSSSATVYGDNKQVPYTEDAGRGKCESPYGWTKWMIEQILEDVAKAEPDFNVMLLRYFNPVGAHESGLIGEDPKGIPNNLMPYVSKVAVGKLEKLGVFGNDYPTVDGTGVRDYIHVVDLARGHVLALKAMDQGNGVRIYNLGTGKGTSVLQVVAAMSKACGHEIPYEIKPRRAGDIAEYYCDPAKAKEELGFTVKYDIEDMCRDSWNWQQKNPDGYQ